MCTRIKRLVNSSYIIQIHIVFVKKKSGSRSCRKIGRCLLLPEGHAVGALVLGRITLMSANQNAIQRAVVCLSAVVCALMHGALDGLVSIAVHDFYLLVKTSALVYASAIK